MSRGQQSFAQEDFYYDYSPNQYRNHQESYMNRGCSEGERPDLHFEPNERPSHTYRGRVGRPSRSRGVTSRSRPYNSRGSHHFVPPRKARAGANVWESNEVPSVSPDSMSIEQRAAQLEELHEEEVEGTNNPHSLHEEEHYPDEHVNVLQLNGAVQTGNTAPLVKAGAIDPDRFVGRFLRRNDGSLVEYHEVESEVRRFVKPNHFVSPTYYMRQADQCQHPELRKLWEAFATESALSRAKFEKIGSSVQKVSRPKNEQTSFKVQNVVFASYIGRHIEPCDDLTFEHPFSGEVIDIQPYISKSLSMGSVTSLPRMCNRFVSKVLDAVMNADDMLCLSGNPTSSEYAAVSCDVFNAFANGILAGYRIENPSYELKSDVLAEVQRSCACHFEQLRSRFNNNTAKYPDYPPRSKSLMHSIDHLKTQYPNYTRRVSVREKKIPKLTAATAGHDDSVDSPLVVNSSNGAVTDGVVAPPLPGDKSQVASD